MHSEDYQVNEAPPIIGLNDLSSRKLVVTEIKDVSIEYEDALHPAYEIYVNGQLYRRLENVPVSIEYFLPSEESK